MTDIHVLPNLLTFSPLDAVLALLSVSLLVTGLKRELKGISIFIQISMLLVKIVKHFYNTHPEAKAKIDKKYLDILDKIYNKNLKVHDRKLISSKESNAIG